MRPSGRVLTEFYPDSETIYLFETQTFHATCISISTIVFGAHFTAKLVSASVTTTVTIAVRTAFA